MKNSFLEVSAVVEDGARANGAAYAAALAYRLLGGTALLRRGKFTLKFDPLLRRKPFEDGRVASVVDPTFLGFDDTVVGIFLQPNGPESIGGWKLSLPRGVNDVKARAELENVAACLSAPALASREETGEREAEAVTDVSADEPHSSPSLCEREAGMSDTPLEADPGGPMRKLTLVRAGCGGVSAQSIAQNHATVFAELKRIAADGLVERSQFEHVPSATRFRYFQPLVKCRCIEYVLGSKTGVGGARRIERIRLIKSPPALELLLFAKRELAARHRKMVQPVAPAVAQPEQPSCTAPFVENSEQLPCTFAAPQAVLAEDTAGVPLQKNVSVSEEPVSDDSRAAPSATAEIPVSVAAALTTPASSRAFVFIDEANLGGVRERYFSRASAHRGNGDPRVLHTSDVNWCALRGLLSRHLAQEGVCISDGDILLYNGGGYGTLPDSAKRRFKRALDIGGVTLVEHEKPNVDTVLTADLMGKCMLAMLEERRTRLFVTLVSGDSDYLHSIEFLRGEARRRGILLVVWVVAWRCSIAAVLERAADRVFYVEDILPTLSEKASALLTSLRQ